eukprot:GHVU01185539.1.p4 GENE.GHVU01185539.1~~GHVU01185539.1.p4  ORF type:complete len:102 (-),score=18.46 GHVU01185539.1:1264-1569(-)
MVLQAAVSLMSCSSSRERGLRTAVRGTAGGDAAAGAAVAVVEGVPGEGVGETAAACAGDGEGMSGNTLAAKKMSRINSSWYVSGYLIIHGGVMGVGESAGK